ncbi:MAG: hypothetical protein KBS94_03320 [Prevotella sp.]|nr:hypothetical protein [Candidatus Equicola faecalis]
MKKLFMSLAAVALLTSCGGSKQQVNAGAEEEKSFEQEQIEANIKMQVDSLASEFAKMGDMPFIANLKEGKIVFSEEEKQVKPEYLIDPATTNDLVTLSQKYRAVAILSADKMIAQAYDMPIDEYDAAIKKLVIDLDDDAFKAFEEAAEKKENDIKEKMQDFYTKEEENGRINFFWDTATAFLVEELYIISQDTNNKFIECFTDESASNITYRIILFQNALNRLKEYAPELEELCDAIQPLEALNAMSVDELKAQLAEMHEQLKGIRNNLLK